MKTVALVTAWWMVLAAASSAGVVMRTNHGMAPPRQGEPVDLAPWAYEWRADRTVQPRPEACFIPRRLERIDRVYRTAHDALPPDQLKSIYYDMPDVLKRLPPTPAGALLAGLLWTGGLNDFAVELVWPDGAAMPPPGTVEVRSYPTAFGWFGWTVDRVLAGPVISGGGRTWSYRSDPSEKMDTSYSAHIPAATEMVAVFCTGTPGATTPPRLRLVSPNLGNWQPIELEIEWGFGGGAAGHELDGRAEPAVASITSIRPLAGDAGTTVTGDARWRSIPSAGARRGIVMSLLHAPDARPGLDSRITLRLNTGAVTFRVRDVEAGPILIPARGLYISKAGAGETARQFVARLASRGPKSVRQMTREHREPASFDELMREVRLWTVPGGASLKPFPEVPGPPMRVELSDRWWTDAWCAAANQLTGEHMWGGLAFEVARVVHAMDLIGLHAHSDRIYDHFLKAPGARPDGDYSDGRGALEWAASMRHDMGYSHDGTHASTGRLLYAMSERCLLTDDRGWFLRNRDRLRAAADWIIRQRAEYARDVPNRARLLTAGLLPPCMIGDYALPACDWHWYYVDNALAAQGLQRFADAMAVFDPAGAAHYRREAAAFRRDLRRVVDREAEQSPVRLGRDGVYHAFIPRMAYARGLTGPELGAPQFPEMDWWMGSLPLAEPRAGIDATDPRIVDTVDMMEEMGTSPAAVRADENARRGKGLPVEDAWFYHPYSILPKASHCAGVYLQQDDVPSFLRFWMNETAIMIGADGKFWEHAHPGNFDTCGAPDNGTAGWFIEQFRNLLVMEVGSTLWVARGTPRSWLQQGRRIAVSNAPTLFGPLAYEIVSDVDHGRITATLDLPGRRPARAVILRLRHPLAAPLRGVTVNGRRCAFDAAKETVTLTARRGRIVVVATY